MARKQRKDHEQERLRERECLQYHRIEADVDCNQGAQYHLPEQNLTHPMLQFRATTGSGAKFRREGSSTFGSSTSQACTRPAIGRLSRT